MTGVSPDATWHERIHQLEPGDTLALYSDGLMERRNLEGNYASLDDWLAALSAMSLTGSAQNIADAIWELSETLGERTDDASLIVVRFTGYQPPVEATLGSWV